MNILVFLLSLLLLVALVSRSALRIEICLFGHFALANISVGGSLVIPVSLPGLFSLTVIVGLVVLEIPCHPIHPSVSRKASHSTISRKRSRATQSIPPIGYNLSRVRDGGRLAPSQKSNNPTHPRGAGGGWGVLDNRSIQPSLRSRTFHTMLSGIQYRKIDKTCDGRREAAL